MKKLLLVIDYQNDFVSGSLGFEQAVSLEDPICRKIESYLKKRGRHYLYSRHSRAGLQFHAGGEKAAGSPLSERKRWLEGLRQGCLLSF